MSKKEDFDYAAFEAEALKQLQSGGKLEGRDGVLAPLLKRLLEASLSGELDSTYLKKNPRASPTVAMGGHAKR